METSPQLNRHTRRRLRTRQRLIDSALGLALEKGYESVSIQDITERADLGRGTFYIHFRDKEEAVWAAFEDLFQELERQAHERLDRRTPQVEYYGLLNIFRHAQENRQLYRLMFGRQGSAALMARAQDYIAAAFLEDVRKAPQTEGIDFNLPGEFEAQLLTGVVTRLLSWWLEGEEDYSAEQMAGMTYTALYRKAPPAMGKG
jgi:AcrR family transcriptional regulator